MSEHDLVEIEHSEHDLSVGDSGITVSEMNAETEKHVVCRECDEQFESDEAAVEHVRYDGSHPAVYEINAAPTDWEVAGIDEHCVGSTRIDLTYTADREPSGKIPIPIMRAVDDAGFVVSGTHTGVDGIDARIWVTESL